jgi:thiol-disulfide isomerase/thioredoxin
LVILLSGCGSSSSPEEGKPAPAPTELEIANFDNLVRNSQKDFVLVNFYATWCGPCRRELPDLVAMAKDTASNTQIMLISIDSPEDVQQKLPSFLTEYGIDFATYTRVSEPGKFIARYYPGYQGTIPLTLIFRKGGEMLEAIVGMTSGKELEMILNRHSKINEM